MYIRQVENLLPNVNKHSDRVQTHVTRFLGKEGKKIEVGMVPKSKERNRKKYSRLLQLYLESRLPSLFSLYFSSLSFPLFPFSFSIAQKTAGPWNKLPAVIFKLLTRWRTSVASPDKEGCLVFWYQCRERNEKNYTKQKRKQNRKEKGQEEHFLYTTEGRRKSSTRLRNERNENSESRKMATTVGESAIERKNFFFVVNDAVSSRSSSPRIRGLDKLRVTILPD